MEASIVFDICTYCLLALYGRDETKNHCDIDTSAAIHVQIVSNTLLTNQRFLITVKIYIISFYHLRPLTFNDAVKYLKNKSNFFFFSFFFFFKLKILNYSLSPLDVCCICSNILKIYINNLITISYKLIRH